MGGALETELFADAFMYILESINSLPPQAEVCALGICIRRCFIARKAVCVCCAWLICEHPPQIRTSVWFL